MCSICRNKNCKYQFDKESWKLNDGEVVFQLPEIDGITLIEAVRVREDLMRKLVTDTLKLLRPSENEKLERVKGEKV